MEMSKTSSKRLKCSWLGASVCCVALGLSGCAYGLPIHNIPSQPRLKVLSPAPDRYVVRVQSDTPTEHQVAPDGRVQVDVPSLPRSCMVYALGIKIRKGVQPHKTKAIHLVRDGKTRKKLSLDDISSLPTDVDGYHLLPMKK